MVIIKSASWKSANRFYILKKKSLKTFVIQTSTIVDIYYHSGINWNKPLIWHLRVRSVFFMTSGRYFKVIVSQIKLTTWALLLWILKNQVLKSLLSKCKFLAPWSQNIIDSKFWTFQTKFEAKFNNTLICKSGARWIRSAKKCWGYKNLLTLSL